MYLSALEVQNFRQFGADTKSLLIKFNKGVTALVGENLMVGVFPVNISALSQEHAEIHGYAGIAEKVFAIPGSVADRDLGGEYLVNFPNVGRCQT